MRRTSPPYSRDGRLRQAGAFARGVMAVTALLLLAPLAAAAAPAPSTERTSKDAGTGAVELPAMTPDGRFEVFVGRGTGNQGVWMTDRDSGTTYRLTSGMHFNPDISADGTKVAYVVYGSTRPIFVIDVTDPENPGPPELVTRSSDGQAANGLSDFPSLNADGRLVGFQSMATNLTPSTPLPGSGGPLKAYVYDRETGTTEMVSVDNSGAAQPGNAFKPDLSADGRYVAFASEADLSGPAPSFSRHGGPGGPGSEEEEEEEATVQQVWVRDRDASTTEAVSVNDLGELGNLGSSLESGPSISANGMVVSFESEATNLVLADTNGRADVYVHDRSGSTTTRVSERTPFDEFGAFHPVEPSRLLDTRDVGVPVGPGETRVLEVAGVGVVPADAAGVALNVTIDQPSAVSFITVFPTGAARPLASNLNVEAGQQVANAVTVKIGTNGEISIYNNAGTAHVIVDLNGWYDDDSVSGGGGFFGAQPTRLLDTRVAPATKLGPGETVDIQVTGVGGVPDTATAAALNVTVDQPTAVSYLTAFPTGEDRPLASNINFAPGQQLANTVIVQLGTDGMVSIYNNLGDVDVIVDLNGWFDGSLPGGGMTGITPERVLDTRTGAVPIGPGETRNVNVLAAAGVPDYGVTSVVLNVTATQPTATSFLTVFPAGTVRPLASNLNFQAGDTVPNEVLVQVGADGNVSVYNNLGSTHVVVDVFAWFSGVQVSEGGYVPATSADGSHVAFSSLSSTLTPGDVNGVEDAFVRDLEEPLTERVSVVDETAGGTEATGTRVDGQTGEVKPQINGTDVVINEDGTIVAFVSNGNLANDRPLDEEDPEGGVSTEPAVFTRTRAPDGV